AMAAGLVPAILAPLTEKQHPEHHRATLVRLIEQTAPVALVAAAATRAQIPTVPIPLIIVDRDNEENTDDDHGDAGDGWTARHRGRPDDIAFLQFSSGTTGLRKGTPVRHRMAVAQITAFQATLKLNRQRHRVASWLPLYHDMGLLGSFLLPLALGVEVVCVDPMVWVREPWLLLDMIERHRATHAWLPNFAFHHLVQMRPTGRSWQL
ncbi:AMP-binding protein, partial [bacterium]|nr:AMP-binding protein [bacterium]